MINMQAPCKYYWLDLLRFTAAFMVVIVHARENLFSPFGALPANQHLPLVAVFYLFSRVGNEAVVAFFVLSGFLVGGKAIERIAEGTFRPLDYAVDRFARIMLPLIPALILTAVISFISEKYINVWSFVGNAFSLQGIFVDSFGGNAPLWSLAYEVWFYLLVGVLGIIIINKYWHPLSIFLLILIMLVFTKLSSTYLFCWLIGALAYVRRPSVPSTTWLMVSIFLVLYSVACVQIKTNSVSISADLQESIKQWVPKESSARILLSTGLALFIQQLILKPPKTSWAIMLEKIGVKGAVFSYSLYLTHYPILSLMPYLNIKQADIISLSSVSNYWFMVVFCVIVAWVTYWLFERHTAKVREFIKVRVFGNTDIYCLNLSVEK